MSVYIVSDGNTLVFSALPGFSEKNRDMLK